MTNQREEKRGKALRAAVCVVSGIVAGAALAHDRGHDAAPAQDTVAGQNAPGPDIVVEGQRDARRLRGGLWTVTLSKSFHYGAPLADWNEQRPSGSEKTWKFCLADAEVEPMMRLLVGEGKSASSGTASCARLGVKIGGGKISGEQRCSGLTMARPQPPQAVFGGEVPTTVVDSCGGASGAVVPATGKLTVSGRYDPESLKLKFYDAHEPLCFDPRYGSQPYGRHWTISGARTSDCDRGADGGTTP